MSSILSVFNNDLLTKIWFGLRITSIPVGFIILFLWLKKQRGEEKLRLEGIFSNLFAEEPPIDELPAQTEFSDGLFYDAENTDDLAEKGEGSAVFYSGSQTFKGEPPKIKEFMKNPSIIIFISLVVLLIVVSFLTIYISYNKGFFDDFPSTVPLFF